MALPKKLAEHATEVLTAHHVRPGERHTDFVAIRLSTPAGGKSQTTWPVEFNPEKHRGAVYGYSASGHVGGVSPVNDSKHRTIAFTLERGEPGQSGTLMYSGSSKCPLGIFFGVRSGGMKSSMTPRGQIVRVPTPDALLSHKVVNCGSKRKFVYSTSNGAFWVTPKKGTNMVMLRDGTSQYTGVFVHNDTSLHFTGSSVCGSSRPKPLQ